MDPGNIWPPGTLHLFTVDSHNREYIVVAPVEFRSADRNIHTVTFTID